ncbi:MAG: aminoacyl-histidine dipeptidase [Deltaproteobacteria bacterium]|nr:aminoacyl-histidine dipeptidase [Deltaproteobacteria bacterium]
MSQPLDNLEPKAVWKYFDEIRKTPHGSGNERPLGNRVMGFARERGCETAIDDAGNVVVRVKASPGCERAPVVVLQGHLDMVCEKNASKVFDFEKDAIGLVRDGDWLKADGTTLGADNGIGVASALAFMEPKGAAHGPLELLFTVDEETGLNGARGLKPGFVTGKLLVNLDSEEDGVFYVGCAGGQDAALALPIATTASNAGWNCCRVEIKGLRGGHSGLDIVHNRGNAVRLLARTLIALGREVDLCLASVEGGDKHNAIPREAAAVISVAPGSADTVRRIFDAQLAGFRNEFASAEPDLALAMTPITLPATVLDKASRDKVLALLLGLPHGVLAMSRDIPGLVETSTNMARVRTGKELTVLCSARSSVASALKGVVAQIEAVGRLSGATVDVHEGYPGWKPNMESVLLAKARKVWTEVHGKEPRFTAIHAGLECGIIGEKFPGIDMISLGPTIVSPHSPDEKVSIPTVARFFGFLTAFLAALTRN